MKLFQRSGALLLLTEVVTTHSYDLILITSERVQTHMITDSIWGTSLHQSLFKNGLCLRRALRKLQKKVGKWTLSYIPLSLLPKCGWIRGSICWSAIWSRLKYLKNFAVFIHFNTITKIPGFQRINHAYACKQQHVSFSILSLLAYWC